MYNLVIFLCVQQKLTQHCKSTLFQLKKKKTGGEKIQLLSLELPGKIQDEQLNLKLRKFPSGPMAMTTRPLQGAWV